MMDAQKTHPWVADLLDVVTEGKSAYQQTNGTAGIFAHLDQCQRRMQPIGDTSLEACSYSCKLTCASRAFVSRPVLGK